MRDLISTNLKPRDYYISEVYRLINRKQVTLFVKHGILPIDIYSSIDKDGNDILVYVYDRESCKDVFNLWNKRELE